MSKNSKIAMIIAFFILLMVVLIFVKFERDHNQERIIAQKTDSLFETVDKSNFAKITKYIVYGTHLNLEGKIEIPKISGISVDSTHVIIKNIDNEETVLDATYEYKEGILKFSSIKKINTGFSLENLSYKNYYIFLKVLFSNNEVKYYSLENTSKYGEITYYTITKNNSNDKIDITFDKYKEIKCMKIKSSKVKQLPDDVFDIVIDPSHGGSDTGVKTKDYTEAELVLKCAKELKQKLENYGYKVFLTRDGTESSNVDMTTNMYDSNGRINTAQESHSKILISLNINEGSSKKGGVEVYAPTRCNLDFAKLLANKIVSTAKTSYSSMNSFKKANGVYVRYFTNIDILGFKSSAILHKYEPYNITNSTPYLYMIREVGGIATGAYVDGRNTSYGKNKYYDSNVGIESYSIELGYMKYENDLKNIVKNYGLYAQAIADSINEFYNK